MTTETRPPFRPTAAPPTTALARAAVLAPAVTLMLTCAGCSGLFGSGSKGGAALVAEDFAGTPGSDRSQAAPASPRPPAATPPVITEAEATEGIVDITASPGSPVFTPRPATATGATQSAVPTSAPIAPPAPPTAPPSDFSIAQSVLVDAKVGDVNGRAVYAERFLNPLAARFEAESKRMPLREWRGFVRKEIANRVDEFITDELLAAEALNTLTPEQKQGFFAWVQALSEGLRRESGGTVEGTERRLANEQGLTLEQWRKTEQQKALIRQQFSDKIIHRVNVSWRDIQQAYNRRTDEFNPPPKITFRLILVPKTDQAGIDAITKSLADGTPFPEVAKTDANRLSTTGGKQERTVKLARAEARFFPNDQVNEAARTLGIGSHAGPIDWERDVAWIYVESIAEKSVPLYEAQRVLEDALFQSKGLALQQKYVGRLRERASMTDTAELVDRLATIAEERFYRPQPAGPKPR